MCPDGVHYVYASRRGAIASFPKNGGWQLGLSGMDTSRQRPGLRNPRTRRGGGGTRRGEVGLLRLLVAGLGGLTVIGIITVIVPFNRKINGRVRWCRKVADHGVAPGGIDR